MGGWEQQCEAYDSTFAEAALQVAGHCSERGALLHRIRKFYKVVVRSEREAREIARKAREEAHSSRRHAPARKAGSHHMHAHGHDHDHARDRAHGHARVGRRARRRTQRGSARSRRRTERAD